MTEIAALAVLAAAAAQAASPAPPATPQAAPADAVQTIVVESGKAPVIGDLQKGVLVFNPTFFTQVRPATAMDMVQWLPGFSFTDTRDMRGLEGAGGNVLVDGKPPTSKTDTLFNVLRRIPSEQVERVDIIVGGAPGIDMHGWPVIANVILKKSATRRGFIGVSNFIDGHGNMTPEVLITSSKNENGRTVEYNLDAGKNLAIFPTFGYGPWVRRDASGTQILAANVANLASGPYVVASGVYARPVAKGTLKLNGSLRYFGTDTNEVDTLTSGPGVYGFTHVQTYVQGEFGATYERPLGPRFTLNTTALERPTHFNVDNNLTRPPTPSELLKNQNDNETVLRSTLRFKRDDKLTLESSAEGSLNSSVSHSDETQNGAAVAIPDSRVDIHERRAELGQTVSWKPGSKTSLDGALKLETSTFDGQTDTRVENSFTYLKPRLVFTWSPDKETQVRGRVEREVGQINFGQFAANSNFASGEIIAGNADIRPQRDWLGELTLERRFWTGGDISLTYRHQEIQDVLDDKPVFLANGTVVSESANIGAGHEDDVVLDVTLPFKRLGLNGAILKGKLTWSQSGVVDPVSGVERRLSNKSAFTGELHFAYDLPAQKLNVGFDAFYQTPQVLYLPLGNQRIGVWGQLTLFAEYRAKPNLNLRIQLQNLPGTRATTVIDAFQGVRGASPLLYEDKRHLTSGPLLFFRARRTFQ